MCSPYQVPALTHASVSGWLLLPSLASPVVVEPENRTLREMGLHHYLHHRLTDALGSIETLLQHYQAAANTSGMIDALNLLGLISCELKDFSQALNWGRQALSLTELHPTAASGAPSLVNLGFIYLRQYQLESATEYFKAALKVFQQSDDAIGVGCVLNNLAVVYGLQGDRDRSHPLSLAAIAALQEACQQEEAVAQFNAGWLHEQPMLALKHLRKAAAIWTARGDFAGEAIAFMAMGTVYHQLEQPFHALSCYQEAVELQRSMGNWAAEATLLEQIAGIYTEEGMPLSALDQLHQSLAVFQFVGDRLAVERLLCQLGKLYESLDELAAAMECYQQALGKPSGERISPTEPAIIRAVGMLLHPSCPIAS